jgi:Arylsulfotransferase (ASST)
LCTHSPRFRRPALVLIAISSLIGATCVLWLTDSRAAAPSVAVFPSPGTRLATAKEQIVFRGVPTSQFGSILVTGSRSGVHSGQVEADSDGNGGSFRPATQFTPGEVVTVKTGLDVLGASHGSFSFTIASPAGRIPYLPLGPAPRVKGDVGHLHSEPGLSPALVRVGKPRGRTAPGDIFVAPQQGPVQDGPEIFNSSGQLVWFHTLPDKRDWATDFRVQTYGGKPSLTWWQGLPGAGIGVGQDVIFDSSYWQIATVKAANGLNADLHEFQLTPRGTALITAYFPVFWNASKDHGSKRSIVLDAVVQEIDVRTGCCCSSGTASTTSASATASFRRRRRRPIRGTTSTSTRSTRTVERS